MVVKIENELRHPRQFVFDLNCYVTCSSSIIDYEGVHDYEIKKFFKDNHYMIGYNMFDEEWTNEIQLEEIVKKMMIIYNFNPNDENLMIVRGPKIVHLKSNEYVRILERGIFVYDKTKIKVDVENV